MNLCERDQDVHVTTHSTGTVVWKEGADLSKFNPSTSFVLQAVEEMRRAA